ncbi:MAG: c-type cytochrome [Bacteroidota bacterium]
MSAGRVAALLAACTLCLVSCQREARQFRPTSSSAAAMVVGPQGGALHAGPAPESLRVASGVRPGQYQETAQAVADGQQLFLAFNCGGCHSDGGGGMGANLMDSRWFYGHQPQQIFDTIVQGRQNGMPSFAGRIPAYQIWELVAYVRSLSGLTSPDVSSGRSDHMEVRPPPISMRMRARLTVAPMAPSDSALPGDTGTVWRAGRP